MAREDLITSVDDLAGFVSYVHDHFDSDNSPLKVVTTNGRKRSIPMNSTQHMWYGEISKQLIKTGRLIWTPEKVKADLKRTFLGDELIEHTNMVTGEVSSAYSPRKTRDLTKGEALHYMEQINAWAANAGLVLTVPNNSEYMKAKRGQER